MHSRLSVRFNLDLLRAYDILDERFSVSIFIRNSFMLCAIARFVNDQLTLIRRFFEDFSPAEDKDCSCDDKEIFETFTGLVNASRPETFMGVFDSFASIKMPPIDDCWFLMCVQGTHVLERA